MPLSIKDVVAIVVAVQMVLAATASAMTLTLLPPGVCAVDPTSSNVSVANMSQCAAACSGYEKCQNINFFAAAGICQLYDADSARYIINPNCTHSQSVVFTPTNCADLRQAGRPSGIYTLFIGSNLTDVYYNMAADLALPRDCSDILASGQTQSGIYVVTVGSNYQQINVYCDLLDNYGGWLVVQRRVDGSQNFLRGWTDYVAGFGNLTGEFWIGNENLYLLTKDNNRNYKLRIDLADFNGNSAYAEYSGVTINNAFDSYRLRFNANSYVGTAGDSLTRQNGYQFSTLDHYNEDTCAQNYQGAWWYNPGGSRCHMSNLNGLYLRGWTTTFAKGDCWQTFPNNGYYYALKFTEIKLKPMNQL